jgi:hypothetical protein
VQQRAKNLPTSGTVEQGHAKDVARKLGNVKLRHFLHDYTVSERDSKLHINLLKPTGHYMYHQFNIQQMYVLPTLYLCVLYLSENKQLLVPITA